MRGGSGPQECMAARSSHGQIQVTSAMNHASDANCCLGYVEGSCWAVGVVNRVFTGALRISHTTQCGGLRLWTSFTQSSKRVPFKTSHTGAMLNKLTAETAGRKTSA